MLCLKGQYRRKERGRQRVEPRRQGVEEEEQRIDEGERVEEEEEPEIDEGKELKKKKMGPWKKKAKSFLFII